MARIPGDEEMKDPLIWGSILISLVLSGLLILYAVKGRPNMHRCFCGQKYLVSPDYPIHCKCGSKLYKDPDTGTVYLCLDADQVLEAYRKGFALKFYRGSVAFMIDRFR